MPRPFIPAPNTALIEAIYTYGGWVIENTFHVQKATPFTSLDLQGACNAFDAWDSTGTFKWQACRRAENVLTQWKARALDTPSSPVFIFTLPTSRPGSAGSGGAMPGGSTFCITMQTGHAGRSQRGRIYLPGLATFDLQSAPNQNLVTAARANAYVASINSLIAQLAALSPALTLVVVSYMSGGAWRSTAQTTPITNAAYSDLAVDSQRRRLAGRGH